MNLPEYVDFILYKQLALKFYEWSKFDHSHWTAISL